MEDNTERAAYDNDSLLNMLIEEFQKSNSSAVVDKSKCRSIGILSYEDNKEKKMSDCFLISATRDGKIIELVYDDKGKVIASKSEKNGMKLELSDDIDLDSETLDMQLNLGEERTNNGNNGSSSSSDTTKAGEGRDLASKEHEEEQDKKQDEFNEKTPKIPENELKNLKEVGINLAGQPLIRLDQIINGHQFWEILGLEEKLASRLPDKVDPKAFRTGYLSVVKSKELTAKDGKERKSEDTLVITTFDRSQIIELDEKVLRPVELRTKPEQVEIEQSRLRFENGEESRKATSNTSVTRTSMYEIPGVNDKFNVAENYYIGIDWDRDYMLEGGKRPETGYKQELYLVQTSRNGTYEERQRGDNALEYKLKPDGEPNVGDIQKNAEMQQDLREKNSNEAIETRREHFYELADECFKKYPDLGDNFNRSDVAKMAKDYHNRGMNDEEIIETIGKECEIAQDVEHDMPGNSRRPH